MAQLCNARYSQCYPSPRNRKRLVNPNAVVPWRAGSRESLFSLYFHEMFANVKQLQPWPVEWFQPFRLQRWTTRRTFFFSPMRPPTGGCNVRLHETPRRGSPVSEFADRRGRARVPACSRFISCRQTCEGCLRTAD